MSYFDSLNKTHVIAFTYYPNLCAIPESFSFQVPSKYFLTCLSNSEMEYLTYDTLQQVFDKSQSIERLFRRMTEAVLGGMINRHIELHSQSIEERYKTFCERSPHLLQLVPHKYIASYLGIDPTNFSKLYNSIKI
jgi:CRP-like cAMP-binding protein